MIDEPHALGWIPNPPGDYPKARHVLGGRALRMGAMPLLAKPNLLPFRRRTLRQGQANSCTAFDLVRRFQLFFQANRGDTEIIASALDIYAKGRLEEYAGMDPESVPALPDLGCRPFYVLRAVVAQGFASEWDYPYTDNPVALTKEPPASLYLKSFSQRGLRWGEIDESGDARTLRIAEALRHRCPVGFGIMIDEAFMANRGQRIEHIDRGKLVGGHMVTALAVLDEELLEQLAGDLPNGARAGDTLIDNWWSDWGTLAGLGVISREVMGSSLVSDVSMLEAVPPMLNRVEP